MKLPPNLADFDFIVAWEELKTHRVAIGWKMDDMTERTSLEWCQKIGPLWSAHKIRDTIDFEKKVLTVYAARRKSDPTFKPTEAIVTT